MRNTYLIAYDVADPKRLRQVYNTLKGAGAALQYSVFLCELNPLEKQLLQEQIWELLKLSEDRLLLADLGPSNSRGASSLETWGEPREEPTPHRPTII